jgi:hypothetical protein
MPTKYAADPTLNTIARRLLTAKWEHPLDEGELAICEAKAEDSELPRHMVTMLRDYKTWVIRAYLAGTQRTFGFVKNEGPAIKGVPWQALRYADMVRMYFWKYKRRDAVEPNQFMLNISVERAKSDLQWEHEVVQIIKDIEQHLKSIGAILPPDQMETALQAKIRQQRARPTAQSVMHDIGGVFQMRMDALEKQITGLASTVNGLASTVNGLASTVNGLATTVNGQAETIARLNSFLENLLTIARQQPPAEPLISQPLCYPTPGGTTTAPIPPGVITVCGAGGAA